MDKNSFKSNGNLNYSCDAAEAKPPKKSWIGSLLGNFVIGKKQAPSTSQVDNCVNVVGVEDVSCDSTAIKSYQSNSREQSTSLQNVNANCNHTNLRVANLTRKGSLLLPRFQSVKSSEWSSQSNRSLSFVASGSDTSPTHQVKYAGFGYMPSIRLNTTSHNSIKPISRPHHNHPSQDPVLIKLAPLDNMRQSFSNLKSEYTSNDQRIVNLLNEKRKRLVTGTEDSPDHSNIIKRRKTLNEVDARVDRTSSMMSPLFASTSTRGLKRPPLRQRGDDVNHNDDDKRIFIDEVYHFRRPDFDDSSLNPIPTSIAFSHDRYSSQFQQQPSTNLQTSQTQLPKTSLKKISGTTRNPIEVSYLSSRRYMERKLRESMVDSGSSNCAASSRRSSFASSVHHDDDAITCLGTSAGLHHNQDSVDGHGSSLAGHSDSNRSTPVDKQSSHHKHSSLLERKGTDKRRIIASPQPQDTACRMDVTSEDLMRDRSLSHNRIRSLMRLRETASSSTKDISEARTATTSTGSLASIPDVIRIVPPMPTTSLFPPLATAITSITPAQTVATVATSFTFTSSSSSSSVAPSTMSSLLQDVSSKSTSVSTPTFNFFPASLASSQQPSSSSSSFPCSSQASSSSSLVQTAASNIFSNVATTTTSTAPGFNIKFGSLDNQANVINKQQSNVQNPSFNQDNCNKGGFNAAPKVPDVVTFTGNVGQQTLKPNVLTNAVEQSQVSQPNQSAHCLFSQATNQPTPTQNLSTQQPSSSAQLNYFSNNSSMANNQTQFSVEQQNSAKNYAITFGASTGASPFHFSSTSSKLNFTSANAAQQNLTTNQVPSSSSFLFYSQQNSITSLPSINSTQSNTGFSFSQQNQSGFKFGSNASTSALTTTSTVQQNFFTATPQSSLNPFNKQNSSLSQQNEPISKPLPTLAMSVFGINKATTSFSLPVFAAPSVATSSSFVGSSIFGSSAAAANKATTSLSVPPSIFGLSNSFKTTSSSITPSIFGASSVAVTKNSSSLAPSIFGASPFAMTSTTSSTVAPSIFGASTVAISTAISSAAPSGFTFGPSSSLKTADMQSKPFGFLMNNPTQQQNSVASTTTTSFNFGSNSSQALFPFQSSSSTSSIFNSSQPQQPPTSSAFNFGAAAQNGTKQQPFQQSFIFGSTKETGQSQSNFQLQANQQPGIGFGKSASFTSDIKNPFGSLNSNSSVPNFMSTTNQEPTKNAIFQFAATASQQTTFQSNPTFVFGSNTAMNGNANLGSNNIGTNLFPQQPNMPVNFTVGAAGNTPTSTSRIHRKKFGRK